LVKPAESLCHQAHASDATTSAPTIERLIGLGMPAHIARLVVQENAQIARRIFLDNSGSTQNFDGKVLDDLPGQEKEWRQCTRWEEICQIAVMHARWNMEYGTLSEFVILNPDSSSPKFEQGNDYFMIDNAKGNGDQQIEQLDQMLQCVRHLGDTPITNRLREIRAQLAPQAAELARSGQKVILVLVTDGVPSTNDGNLDYDGMVQELRRFSTELPVQLVVRLCTDDDEVAEFYNQILRDLELQLDIIDDMVSEAGKAYKRGNSFFAYTPIIQLLREGGTSLKVLNVLGERHLNPTEAALVSQLLVRGIDDPPLPTEPGAFCKEVARLLKCCPLVYDVYHGGTGPALNLSDVQWSVLPKGVLGRDFAVPVGSCSLM